MMPRRLCVFAVVCVAIPLLSGCMPTAVEYMAAVRDPRLICIRSHESAVGEVKGDPYHMRGSIAGLPNSEGSSATGPYQIVKGTWPHIAQLSGFSEWAKIRLKYVPLEVQHVAVYRYVHQHGAGPWGPDHC